jgi:integrase
VPKALAPADIERLLNSFDRTTPIGQRDYAMAHCLVDLGLRAGEVARLQIDDVNWHASTLRIKGAKGQRVQLLPLPSQTGKAIVDYRNGPRILDSRLSVFCPHILWPDHAAAGHSTLPS